MNLSFRTGFGLFLVLGCFLGFYGNLLTPAQQMNYTITPQDMPIQPYIYGRSTGEIDFKVTTPITPLEVGVNYTFSIQMIDKHTFEPINSNETIWIDFYSSVKNEIIDRGFIELTNGYAEFTLYSEIEDFILMTIETEITTEYYYIIIGNPYFDGVEM